MSEDSPPPDSPQPPTIAVDAMGGDHAPAEIVAGAIAAAAADHGMSIVLTGRPSQLRPLLGTHRGGGDIRVAPADELVAMDEGALASWRRPRSSVAVACQLVRRGQAAAVVSAGSTAGIVATAGRTSCWPRRRTEACRSASPATSRAATCWPAGLTWW